MARIVTVAARLVWAAQRAWERKWSFLVVCALVFLVSIVALGSLDLLPERAPVQVAEASSVAPSVVLGATVKEALPSVSEVPLRITAKSIGLDARIANPASTDIGVLDAALLSGAVRYPTSAQLGENGNVVVFGHSSYLPVVHNQAYKTFDGIQDLKVGETVTVYSANRLYTYAVKSVEKVSAENGAIPLSVTGRTLTLATCDSFGKKSDRFVVTAEFVESHAISS